MGSIGRRLEALEESFLEEAWANDGLEEILWRAAYRSLSVVEMHVMGELRDAYRARPGLSPAEVWHELTEAQRAMQYRWLTATRHAARDLIEAGNLPPDEEAELKGFVREVGNYPFWKVAGEPA
ncbi:MAG: hypothetical protein H0T57_03200 [Rubrobacter sp.]|nr:hypothetical protein [Rubrobacter sp.]